MKRVHFGVRAACILTFFLMLSAVARLLTGLRNAEGGEALEAEVYTYVLPETGETEADPREFIAVYENGEARNLYDLMGDRQILYFKLDACEDCRKYHDVIIERLEELPYPYLVLEASKEPEMYGEGMAVSSALIKSIGIGQVPALAFVRDGSWVMKLENEFTMAGTEIVTACQQVFE